MIVHAVGSSSIIQSDKQDRILLPQSGGPLLAVSRLSRFDISDHVSVRY